MFMFNYLVVFFNSSVIHIWVFMCESCAPMKFHIDIMLYVKMVTPEITNRGLWFCHKIRNLMILLMKQIRSLFSFHRFDGPPREINIDSMSFMVPVDRPIRVKIGMRAHMLAFGGPGQEVMIDGKPYEVMFNGPPRQVKIGEEQDRQCLRLR